MLSVNEIKARFIFLLSNYIMPKFLQIVRVKYISELEHK